MQLSIIIPVYNEQSTIGDIIARTKTVTEQTGIQSEIIVVDDRSFDDSLEIAKHYGIKPLRSEGTSWERLRFTSRFSQG